MKSLSYWSCVLVLGTIAGCSQPTTVQQSDSPRPVQTPVPAQPVATAMPSSTPTPGPAVTTPTPSASAPVANFSVTGASLQDLSLDELTHFRLKQGEGRIYRIPTIKDKTYACSLMGPGLSYDLIADTAVTALTGLGVQATGPHSIFTGKQQNAYLRMKAASDTEGYLVCQPGFGTILNPDSLSPRSGPENTNNANNTADFSGTVYDSDGAKMSGVSVRARSLLPEKAYDATIITNGGVMAFNNLPSGVPFELTATLAGYGPRRQILIALHNDKGVEDFNRYDFGVPKTGPTFGESHTALSLKPDVSGMSPAAYSVFNPVDTPISLRFSKSVERESVERNFVLYALAPDKPEITDRTPVSQLRSGRAPAAVTVWDRQAFDVSWNPVSTEVSLKFKPGFSLPTVHDKTKTPEYLLCLTLNDSLLRDIAGFTRAATEPKFKLGTGDFETCGRFGIAADTTSPQATLLATPSAAQKNTIKAGLILTYSEAMQLPGLGKTYAGGLNGDTETAPAALGTGVPGLQAAGNYRLTLTRNGKQIRSRLPWSSLGGQAMRDPDDNRRVILTLPDPRTILLAGDEVEIEVGEKVQDPAGNAIDSRARVVRTVYAQE